MLTWTCHICGKERPDDKISVHSHPVKINTIEVTENVRYCNDNPACAEAAKTFHFLKGGET